MSEPAAPPPPPPRAGSSCGLQLTLIVVLALFGGWKARSLSLHVRAPALLHVDDLDALVAAADQLMATPASHGLYGTQPAALGAPPTSGRPLASLPGPLVAARPAWVRVDGHEVVLTWPDGGAPEQDASGPRGADTESLDGAPTAPARPASGLRRTHHTDNLGRAITVFADDDEGRRRAEALRSAPWDYTAREQVHPRAWASHGVH